MIRAGFRHIAPALLVAGLAFTTTDAGADGGNLLPRGPSPKYAEECGACHLAYPPALLPAASWRRIVAGLDRHYGTDASLDAAAAAAIGRWLDANAGTYKRVAEAPPADRITNAAWFTRKHRKLADATWQNPAIKSRANCAACHTGAAQGDYDDDRIRIPR